MAGVYSVGQVNTYIRNMFNQDILLSKLSIKGEVSNCKYHSSGHIYFTIKDDAGAISAVMFAGKRSGLDFRLADGLQVVVTGNVTVYERDGKYQMYASKIVQDGAGDLFLRYQKLKNELEEMGMFAEEYKKPIPRHAKTVGIVTAATGAAVRDIMNIAKRRNPYVQLVLYSAIVQGEYAVPSIVKGIRCLDEYGVDVIIVGRGGGSIEDLWAFNEEAVARAIFECNTPIISAVGHETDFTIADFVSDLRAPTPSAAAELAVSDFMQVEKQIFDYKELLRRAMKNKIQTLRERLLTYSQSFRYLNPVNRLCERRQNVLDYEERLNRCIKDVLKRKRHQLELLSGRLDGVSPLKRIMAGYAYVESQEGTPVKSIDGVHIDDKIKITLADGIIESRVIGSEKKKLPSS